MKSGLSSVPTVSCTAGGSSYLVAVLLNILVILGLKGCAILLKKKGLNEVDEILPSDKLEEGFFKFIKGF